MPRASIGRAATVGHAAESSGSASGLAAQSAGKKYTGGQGARPGGLRALSRGGGGRAGVGGGTGGAALVLRRPSAERKAEEAPRRGKAHSALSG